MSERRYGANGVATRHYEERKKLDTLFLAAYSRLPRSDERERFLKVVRAKPDPEAQRQAYANIFWALLNSPEFVLCP